MKTPGIIFIVLDDMLLEKFGEVVDSVYRDGPKEGKLILAHDLVSRLIVCTSGQVVQIDLRHCAKASVYKEERREKTKWSQLRREGTTVLPSRHSKPQNFTF